MIFDSKERKLKKILKDGKAIILAFDHAVEHGPQDYENVELNPERIGRIAYEGGADGVILHIGAAKIVRKLYPKLPVIVKLTARTSLTSDDIQIQEIVTKVEEAKKIGAVGIAATVYFGSNDEHRMFARFSEIKKDAEKFRMPIFGFAYHRSVKFKSKYDPVAVRYAARVGAEIGFDVVKTYYTGDKESFSKVVKDCFVPVLVAGGPKIEDEKEFLKIVEDVMSVGARGVVVGRNVWERRDEDAIKLLMDLRRIIHK
ncbi:MAG: 2-amino-3,7-dideoxy-D-threo-hept-6-ulosonate synthase [Candidatus Aenigmarchaeota archaeon]|nr:2-amino-3,7-dideoxy-D-threo-hept-6-ulosonate synthase [Candidatus Aenigmarchaeota archaeon]MCX8190692.1 2-amino-3,7-dideoxy-D-threo-hept-6-ulosonate synthase [Candidatus Aenigmarchaeota archaeon]MDW8159941.1 2-amino-3,7-dideoxy-D-threo-hept-6-ulosonate synthase [Candidatus Aenigmarchaeota archaeon]